MDTIYHSPCVSSIYVHPHVCGRRYRPEAASAWNPHSLCLLRSLEPHAAGFSVSGGGTRRRISKSFIFSLVWAWCLIFSGLTVIWVSEWHLGISKPASVARPLDQGSQLWEVDQAVMPPLAGHLGHQSPSPTGCPITGDRGDASGPCINDNNTNDAVSISFLPCPRHPFTHSLNRRLLDTYYIPGKKMQMWKSASAFRKSASAPFVFFLNFCSCILWRCWAFPANSQVFSSCREW